ncbi:MAG: hypothetical protein RIF41_19985 [Polyangiaceae bacterium]
MDEETTKILAEIRDLQREALDRQTRFLWVLVPIFAVLCIQTVLTLTP